MRRVFAANAPTLKVLRMISEDSSFTSSQLAEILVAAPQLSCLEVSTTANTAEEARRYLRNEPPYGPLQMQKLSFHCATSLNSHSSMEAFCKDICKHPSLRELAMHDAPLGTAAAMHVFVDGALNLQGVFLHQCDCTPAAVPELTRLVSAGAVRALAIENNGVEIFVDEANTELFCAAVRSSSLKSLGWNTSKNHSMIQLIGNVNNMRTNMRK